MNKKSISLLIVALSLISLSLAAFAPMNVEPDELDRYGGPGNRIDTQPSNDGTCDADCTGTGENVGGNSVLQGSRNSGFSRSGSGYGLTPLSDAEAQGLALAIEEEYKARALYEYVMETFGSVSPFAEIAVSEATHVSVLIRQADKYGVDYPAYDPSIFDFPVFATVDDAYQAGIDAEIEDAALYDTLLADVTHEDIARVYTNLKTASLENHLVSFQEYLNN
jgi:hypothetical protein